MGGWESGAGDDDPGNDENDGAGNDGAGDDDRDEVGEDHSAGVLPNSEYLASVLATGALAPITGLFPQLSGPLAVLSHAACTPAHTSHADTINNLIKDVYVPTMQDVELDGVKYDAPKPIPWYPDNLAWEVAAPKRVVRKQEAFKKFQKFLVGETDVVSG